MSDNDPPHLKISMHKKNLYPGTYQLVDLVRFKDLSFIKPARSVILGVQWIETTSDYFALSREARLLPGAIRVRQKIALYTGLNSQIHLLWL